MKTRRRILQLLLFIFFLISLLFIYLQVGFLPGRLRSFVIQKTQELSRERVVFDKALYVPFKGLSFTNFMIVSQDGRVLFQARSLALDVRLIPFLKEKKLMIRNIRVDSPVYDWALKGAASAPPKRILPPPKTKISGQIALPVLPPEDAPPDLTELETGPDAFLPENVYIEQLEIHDGRVLVRETADGPVVEEIRPIRLKMGFQRPPILRFSGSFGLGTAPYAGVDFSGGWDLEKIRYDFNLKASARKIPEWLVRYQKNNAVVLKKGVLELECRIVNAPRTEKTALFHMKTTLDGADMKAGDLRAGGQMELEADGLFDFTRKSIGRYRGRLDLSRVRAEHPVAAVPLEDLSGSLYFNPDAIRTKSITAAYGPLVLEASGTLRSFTQLILDATLKTKSELSDLASILPENQKGFLKEWALQGLCDAKVTLRGTLKDPARIKWEAVVGLEDVSAKNAAKKIEITEVSTQILAGPEGLRLFQGRLAAFGQVYRVEGEVPFTPDKSGVFSIRSTDMEAAGSYSWRKDAIKILEAAVSYQGLHATLRGTSSGFEKPYLDLAGNFDVDLETFIPKIQKQAPALRDAGLKGAVKGRFQLAGLADSPIDWDLKMDAETQSLKLKEKFVIDDVQAQIRMKKRILNIPYLHAKPYGGSGGFRSSFDLARPGVPFNGKMYLNDVDLTLLARDLGPEQKDLAGKLSLTALLKGRLDAQETFQGNGRINIREGRIWKTDLFKDMGNLPFVKVIGLDQVVFHALNANFKVADKKIKTDDMTLHSDTVHLRFKGHVGFDQTLDLVMWIRYSDAVFRGAVDTGGIVPFVVEKVEQIISQYHIGGTIKTPKNEKILAPPV